jgi:hypothetical protein
MERKYYIVSTNHTLPPRRERYITFWRPDDKGYCWPLSWAGEYSEKAVMENLGYYNSGRSAIAVLASVVDALAEIPRQGDIDGNAGPVVRNTKRNWRMLRAAVIQGPSYEVKQAV